MVTALSTLSGTYFTSAVPDVPFTISGAKAGVAISIDGDTIYNECLYPVSGNITLTDIGSLVEAMVRTTLTAAMIVTITDMSEDDSITDTLTMTAQLVFCRAEFTIAGGSIAAEDFCNTHFLTTLQGVKVTAPGRLEYLHYTGTDTPNVVAAYSDGSTRAFTPPIVQGNDRYTTIDVSPSRFISLGFRLIGFRVEAGSRLQEFAIDFSSPDCAPVLLFSNSFGCDELLYCFGKHQVSPSYKRDDAYLDGVRKNFKITETRTFKADTGWLNTAMANWADELFRSDYIRVVNFYGGSPTVGKEIIVTDSKSEYSNLDDDLPRFTFSYCYAQRNQQVIDLQRAGRIFDNTFDNTFN